MWTIEKPVISALEAFDTCIAGVTTGDLKQRLRSIRAAVEAGETSFDDAAEASSLYLIVSTENVGPVTAKEMEKLYDRHMARGRSRGRAVYDRLMIAAQNDMCPFCGHRIVSTLDHSLPKATHPVFAVTPINLVPCCKDCNHAKGVQSPLTKEDQLLNAYYDDITADRWLYAEIVEGSPPAARFFVEAPDDWAGEIATRVENHFKKLHLAKLYASQAARQFQNARADLERRFRSYNDVMVNSWEGALYQAAAASEWYCDGGFRA
jgi:hypothetical protein